MRRVLLTFLALILTTLAGAVWYASDKGFTNKWRRYVSDEFRKRGVEVTLKKLNLDLRRGLVAKDVRLFDAHDQRRTLAVIDEMALQVNYANLMRGQTFLDALDLRDANLSLPLDPEKPRGPKIDIVRLNARLFLPPQQIYLAHADAEIFGVRVSASGRLIHPRAFPYQPGSHDALAPELIDRIFEQIQSVTFEGAAPEVSVTFSGDLAEPGQLFVDVALWGEHLRRGDYALRSLYLAASYRGGVLDLKQCVAVDAAGDLRLSGLWNFEARHGEMQLRSSLDAPALVRSFGRVPWLDDFVFYKPPQLDLRLDLSLKQMLMVQAIGHLGLQKFTWRSTIFEQAAADFSWNGPRWSLRDLRLIRSGGQELSADALCVPGDFRARLTSEIDPKVLRPLLTGKVAETLSEFKFDQPPKIAIEARGAVPKLESVVVVGEVNLGSASFRGVPASSLAARVRMENQVLSIAPFRVERSEGENSGALYYDFRHDELRLEKVQVNINPPGVANVNRPETRPKSEP